MHIIKQNPQLSIIHNRLTVNLLHFELEHNSDNPWRYYSRNNIVFHL